MKKWLCSIIFIGIFLLLTMNFGFASEVRQGASPLTTGVNSNTIYQNITFPYNTRDLIVQNNDATAYIYVDVKSATNTDSLSDCFLLGPGNEINLYDYITGGISLIYDNGGYSTDTEASPISILAVY